MSYTFNTRESHDLLIRPVVSEKGYDENQFRKYRFEVRSDANKIEIKRAVEEIFKVKVEKINIMVQPGKRRRMRNREGFTQEWKKAVVTLKEGHHIDFFEKA